MDGGPVFFRGNLNRHDLPKFINATDAFTTEILQLWSEIRYEANVNSIPTIFFHYLYGTNLWYESTTDAYIINRGAVKVSRTIQTFLKTRIPFLSSYELKERYNVKTNFLVLHGLKSSLKSMRQSRSLSITSSQSFLQSFLKAKKPTKVFYERLVTIKQKTLFKARKNCLLIVNSKVMKWLMTGSWFTYSRLNAGK